MRTVLPSIDIYLGHTIYTVNPARLRDVQSVKSISEEELSA